MHALLRYFRIFSRERDGTHKSLRSGIRIFTFFLHHSLFPHSRILYFFSLGSSPRFRWRTISTFRCGLPSLSSPSLLTAPTLLQPPPSTLNFNKYIRFHRPLANIFHLCGGRSNCYLQALITLFLPLSV